jgi:hypothetical protein
MRHEINISMKIYPISSNNNPERRWVKDQEEKGISLMIPKDLSSDVVNNIVVPEMLGMGYSIVNSLTFFKKVKLDDLLDEQQKLFNKFKINLFRN